MSSVVWVVSGGKGAGGEGEGRGMEGGEEGDRKKVEKDNGGKKETGRKESGDGERVGTVVTDNKDHSDRTPRWQSGSTATHTCRSPSVCTTPQSQQRRQPSTPHSISIRAGR